MKQIIPFKKELLFKTKVSEITSISLEHTLSLKNEEMISGEFHITGDYKMTEGSINREEFAFHLPFEIALDSRYDMSSIVIDIDNFYYEIVNNESLQVNIDVYVEGERIEEEVVEEIPKDEKNFLEEPRIEEALTVDVARDEVELVREEEDRAEEEPFKEELGTSVEHGREIVTQEELPDLSNLQEEIKREEEEEIVPNVVYQSPEVVTLDSDNTVTHNEFNIFENIDNSDTYVTYHVYIVKENDTLDTILSKYGVLKEDVLLYNNLEDIKPGAKLIIPNTNE